MAAAILVILVGVGIGALGLVVADIYVVGLIVVVIGAIGVLVALVDWWRERRSTAAGRRW